MTVPSSAQPSVGAPPLPAAARTPVGEAIAAMALAVQRGNFAAAEAAGAAAELHLAMPKHVLRGLAPLSDGAQAAVFTAEVDPAFAHLLPGVQPAADGRLLVAVKRAHIRDAADLERFRREARLLAELRHPHLARLLGARLLPPGYQAVLQLEAASAAQQLHGAGWRPGWAAALALGAQLAAAVAHMHAAGWVHRDIKPANVLLNAARDHARLADLGLAEGAAALASGERSHAAPTGGFHKQRMVGTLEYMAPEVLLASAHSPASDVFALAVTLNELAAGQVPYSDCTRDNPLAHTILEMGYGRQELAAAVAAEGLRPTLAPGAPPAVARLLAACWQRQPSARPAAAEVAAALAALAAEAAAAGGGAVQAPAPVAAPTAAEAQRSMHPPAAVAAVPVPRATQPDAAPASAGPPAWLAVLPPGAGAGAAAAAAAAPVFAGEFLTAGRRDSMEDVVAVLPDVFGAAGAPGCTAIGVFDGHRGASAAEFLRARLKGLLAVRLPGSASAEGLLRAALADADEAYRAEQDAAWADRLARMGAAAAGACPAPGSTATLLLVYPGWPPHERRGEQPPRQMLATACLGDSRAVLCRGGQAVQLTRDHTADDPAERARVVAAGGAVAVRAGGWRVGTAGLQVTRSVGDADLKVQGVSAVAEAASLALGAADSFLVVATDGLWDRVSNEDAVALVQDTVKHPGMSAQRLALEALARGSGDNVAVVVAFLNSDGSTVERVYDHGRLKYGGGEAAAERRKALAASLPAADELHDTY